MVIAHDVDPIEVGVGDFIPVHFGCCLIFYKLHLKLLNFTYI